MLRASCKDGMYCTCVASADGRRGRHSIDPLSSTRAGVLGVVSRTEEPWETVEWAPSRAVRKLAVPCRLCPQRRCTPWRPGSSGDRRVEVDEDGKTPSQTHDRVRQSLSPMHDRQDHPCQWNVRLVCEELRPPIPCLTALLVSHRQRQGPAWGVSLDRRIGDPGV
jgi:hypothetical protein